MVADEGWGGNEHHECNSDSQASNGNEDDARKVTFCSALVA